MGEQTRRRDPTGLYVSVVKPLVDRAAGLVLSVVTLPLVAALGLLIRRHMGGPAVFTQRRIGRHGRPFTIYKLRTMLPDRRSGQEPFDGPDRRRTHKSVDDPRHTPVGRFLRKWSLDELPQFWNVALGHMSLVGPRPELVDVVTGYEPWQHRRHCVKPGITGLWQISERGDVPMHEATELDLDYVDSVSLRTDLQILARTVPAMLGRTGA